MSRTLMFAGAAGLALLMSAGVAFADSYGGVAGDYPPNARPGQCFARVLTPEVYETITDRVLDVPEKTELHVVPAEWGVDYKSVMVKEGFHEFVVIPATYRTVTETVVVKHGYTHLEVIPATYETVSERVLVREAYTVWKPGKGLAGTPGYTGYSAAPHALPPGAMVDGRAYYGPTKVAPTGELLCLVEVPAEYRTINKTVLRSPARTVETAVPPVTKVVTRTVVDVDAHVEKRDIAPVYDRVQIAVLAHPERVDSVAIAPVYKVVERKRLVGGGKLEWREVICDDKLTGPLPSNAIDCNEAGASCGPRYAPPAYTPRPEPRPHRGTTVTHSYDGERGYVTPQAPAPDAAAQVQGQAQGQVPGGNMIARMQQALQSRGYYAGPVDGLYTGTTSEALQRFQKDNRMASGQLTLETARALGIWN